MKQIAWLVNNEIKIDNNFHSSGQKIVERTFTQAELDAYAIGAIKVNTAGTDIVIDQAKIDQKILDKKNEIYNKIDKRTQELIFQGFTHNNVLFSLSNEAQQNLTALVLKQSVITYPRPLSTKDNGVYTVANASEMDTIGMKALAAKDAHIQTGHTEKAAVNAMATLQELAAYVDIR